MATYFHGNSEIQADGLQTLYLMNPGYVGYSDTQQQQQQQQQPSGNMVFMNPAILSQNQTQNHHFVGIPLQPTPSSEDPNRHQTQTQQEISGGVHGFIPRVHYNLWSSMDHHQQHHHHHPTAASAGGGTATHLNHNSVGLADYTSQLGLRRSSMVPPSSSSSQQGLSLSLSPQQTGYGNYRPESDIQPPVISPTSGDEIRVSGGNSSSSASGVSNGTSNVQNMLLGSKYLKVAQQLLDEVVNVGNGIKTELSKGSNKGEMMKELNSVTGEASIGGGESSGKRGADLSTAERQELQMKKAKLVSMLDEVEQRYRQYHHQMQIVIASFEQAAGFGSAKTYTALALQTISKQFRCLKDAISAQIRTTGKSLGEDDCLGGGKIEGSRLRFVDHQLRQQRALQQLGMIQHNAWRPQRGLPERSVSILRAWLFEHFLHPYPKDSDKVMLAKQTGLTRSQVSNWFINARVRLWKPMVEEMYMEEVKDHEQNGGLGDKAGKGKLHNEESGSKSTSHQENSPNSSEQTKNISSKHDNPTNPNNPTATTNSSIPASIMEGNIRNQSGFFLVGSSDAEGFMQGNPKKSRNNELQNSQSNIHSMDMDMKSDESNRELCMNFGNERQNRDGYSLITSTANHGGGGGGGFGAYSMGEMGRFDPEQYTPRFSGNGVSLTLGLPHCENLSLSGAQQTYLSNQNIQLGRRLEMGGGGGNEPNDYCGINPPTPSHSTTTYEDMNMQNRKRFAAQLLPDFVT